MGKPRARKKAGNVTSLYENPDDFFDRGPNNTVKKETPSGRKYRKNITPRTPNQQILATSLEDDDLTFAIGKPGSGKTFLSVAKGIEALDAGQFDKIVLTRPAVEAGEKLGYLPGDMKEKVDPYLLPLYDAILERMPKKRMEGLIHDGKIEIAPVGFLRGRTLSNAYVICDEAQNCTYMQLKMIYTRMGLGSKMVFTGDLEQSDIHDSGLAEMVKRLDGVSGISVCRLEAEDIVRHPLLAKTAHLL